MGFYLDTARELRAIIIIIVLTTYLDYISTKINGEFGVFFHELDREKKTFKVGDFAIL